MWLLLLKHQYALLWIIAITVAVATSVRVIWETRSPSKTAAYLLLILLLPIGGSVLYLLVGVNYRKRRIYNKKIVRNAALFREVKHRTLRDSDTTRKKHTLLTERHEEVIDLLLGESLAPLSENQATLLLNGEQKFPTLLKALEEARHFIHIEYYIFDDDHIGNTIKETLIKKAKEGVTVRIIFDDFGSHDLWDSAVKDMRSHGIQIYPFYRIHFILFANRINYRDHRKVVIIDGHTGFTGGINIADRYINTPEQEDRFWRDTHVMIKGAAVLSLQYHFLANWNFCAEEHLGLTPTLFPESANEITGEDLVQIVTSGPDYPSPSIMLAYFTAIMEARQRVYITTPYFIPNESILNAIKKAAFSGKDVRILLPLHSDSTLVDAASRFYVQELLEAGVKIYFYTKGFIHAKTMVIDESLSFVGTANMDLRSFELNFEINAVIYGEQFTHQLHKAFMDDLQHSDEMSLAQWNQRNKLQAFVDAMARILAPLL